MTWPAVVGGEAWMRRIERRVSLIERRAGGGGGVAGGPPIGGMIEWPSSVIPTGYLLCNGQAVSRTTYAALFAQIGTTYGVGDNSTTFNVPDRRGRVGVGLDATQTEFTPLGKTGGAKTHTHPLSDAGAAQISMSAVANASITARRVTTAGWTAALVTNNSTGAGSTAAQATGTPLMGATDAASSLPPYLVLNYIINATGSSGGGGGGGTTLSVQDTETLDLTLTGNPTSGYILKGDVLGGTGGGSGGVLPAGSLVPWAGTGAIPTGFLLADGSAVSRTLYSDLFAKIGTQYGVGDNSTTFNLPNMKGKVAVGQDTAQTEFDVLGETGGTKVETLTSAQIPAHTHPITFKGGLAPQSIEMQSLAQAGTNRFQMASGTNDWAAAANTGGGGSHNNLQPYLVQKYLISIGTGGTGGGSRGVVGEIISWTGDTAPEDFLLCQGQFVDKVTYAALYAVTGDKYLGSATAVAGQFRLPQMSGRVLIGPDGTHLMGSYQGVLNALIATTQLPAHSHPVGHNGGQDTFTYPGGPNGGTFNIVVDSVNSSTGGYNMQANGQGGTTGQPFSVEQQSTTVNFAIRYRTSLGANDTKMAAGAGIAVSGTGSTPDPYTVAVLPGVVRRVGYATTASATVSAAINPILTVTLPADGLAYTVRAAGMIANGNSGAARTADLRLTMDGVTLGATAHFGLPVEASASPGVGFHLEYVATPAAGSRVFTLSGVASVASAVLVQLAALTIERTL